MKVRLGFVGNSSSSSFIIGLAKVVNIKAAQKEVSDQCLSVYKLNWEGFITLGEPLLPENNWWDNVAVKRTSAAAELTIDSFTGAEVRLTVTPETNYIIVVAYDGDEGDGEFWDKRKDEMKYNITESFFDGSPRERALEVLRDKDICTDSMRAFGAGRNG